MVSADDIKAWITAGIEVNEIDVQGDGRHFFATIVSDAFEGKSLIKRHQLIYGVLGDKMDETIHALSLKTLTPAEKAG